MNCIILHGCPSNPDDQTYDKHWIPWIKEQLLAQGIEVEIPLTPEPWSPNYEKFKEAFEKCEVRENSVLIGHSCGCAFLVRWLGETKQKVKKLILVAPWKIPDGDDEEDEGKESVEIFHEALDGRVIELKGYGHYTMGDMGTNEFPELLTEITR